MMLRLWHSDRKGGFIYASLYRIVFMFAFVTLITMWIQALLAKWQPTILRSFWLRTLTFIIIGYALMAPTLYIGSLLLK